MNTRTISAVAVLAIAGTLLGCGRIHLATETYPLADGEVVVEHYDDPVDNLKSYRLSWRCGRDEREVIDELWGTEHDHGVREPMVVNAVPLTLGFGSVLYRRQDDGEWLKVE